MKLLFVVGARPQFIKLSPLCRTIASYTAMPDHESIKSVIVHTGQHYDYELSKVFFDELQIPAADYNLEVRSGSHGEQTGAMIERLERVLLEEQPDVVIVFGDTNSTLAGALAASKLGLPVAHVEAGLRSFNRRMPEEINRVVVDHVSTLLFCPTDQAVSNLRLEGFINIVEHPFSSDSLAEVLKKVTPSNPLIVKAGDVMYDALSYNEAIAVRTSTILKDLSLSRQQYALLTIHRAENTDKKASIERIVAFLEREEAVSPIIFPVHPRTKRFIEEEGIQFPNSVKMVAPVSYLDMLVLERNSAIIYTDSGGVQKEAFIMRIPCVTLREETEWTETVKSGWNRLMSDSRRERQKGRAAYGLDTHPFGNGNAAENHFRILMTFCQLKISKARRFP
jgi:UDP-N-acetylglucosamine 2-epimerase